MSGRLVIACYRPHPGKLPALRTLIHDHVPNLRTLGLVTDRAPIIMEAKDGTIVEVFEWRSREAIEAAHAHPAVAAMWQQYQAVCDYVPVSQVPEAAELFSEFTPLAGGAPVRPASPPGSRPGGPPLNRFGDPRDTLYTGGTPAFDETGGLAPRKKRR